MSPEVPQHLPGPAKWRLACEALGITLDPRLEAFSNTELLLELEFRFRAGANKTEIGRRAFRPQATPEEIRRMKDKNFELETHYLTLETAILKLRGSFADMIALYPLEPR